MVWPFRARGKRRAQSHEERAARTIRELTESRRVIVDAYEVERRRIERDLHDGAQQYLVAAKMQLGEAQLSPALAHDPALAALLRDAQHTLQQGLDSLRATVRGIHPQALVELGLEAALTDVANATNDDVRIICPNPLPELPEGVLAAAYFFAVEAITNARKYAPDKPMNVLLTAGSTLRISVVDQGPGGATFVDGHGLAGMRERLAAFGGSLTLSSPDGGPTQVAASIPLLLRRGEGGLVAHAAAHPEKDLP